MVIKNAIIAIIFHSLSIACYSQCEELNGDSAAIGDWKQNFRNYFDIDSAFDFIESDSVLIFYFTNSQNHTTNGMACCYYLAAKYAQSELDKKIKILYNVLNEDDAEKLQIAQQAWQTFYKYKSKFLKQSFVSYSNYRKYDLGREIMIESMSWKYQIIKGRILFIDRYLKALN